jgi:REP element-mobilizing transposase RayT
MDMNLVYSWFKFIKESYSIKTTSYVIMPNHVHSILFFPTDQYDLSKIVANGKKFYVKNIAEGFVPIHYEELS